MFRSRVTGSTAIFRGMKDASQREKLKSINLKDGKICWIWCEEATELDAADADLLDDRLRGHLDPALFYQISFSFNPVCASHWLKTRFFDALPPDSMVHVSTFLDNCFLDTNYHIRMRQRAIHDPDGYKIYALGEWGQLRGQILTHFKVAPTPRDPLAFDALALGCDFGFNHPHATLLLGLRDGCVFVLDEWLAREMDTDEIIKSLSTHFAQRWPRLDIKELVMWCDCAEPDRIKTFRRHSWNARPVKKKPGSVLAQIDWLKARPLIIDPACSHTITELQNWRWQEEKKSGRFIDIPAPFNDDAISALRYGIDAWRNQAKICFD